MAAEERLPRRIGKYELGEALGRGTCGVVHRAHDPFVGRDVAIKVAHPGETAKMLRSGRERRTFFSEAHAAGQLTHPHIVAVYDAGMEGAYSYIVMEYVAGDTLNRWGRNGDERLAVERVVDIAFRCCRALDYAHGRGIVHRDIKPSNVMIAHDGTVKLADFSLALLGAHQHDAATPGVAEGTPHYMAPEQVRGSGIGPAADLYALGVLMFELLSGRVPFSGRDMKQLFEQIEHAPPPPLAQAAPTVPAEVGAIVDRLLRKDPRERFGSGAEVAGALGRVYDRLRRSEQQLAKGEHRNLLRGLGFFDGFGEREIDVLLEASSLLQFRAGEPIVREGELESSFYILAAGSARVEKGGVAIETLGKGDCFGEMGFVAETRRSATITAVTDSIVLRMSRSGIELAPTETQLLYYRTFAETLVYRLAVTSARLAAAMKHGSGQ
ncbi:MAG: serine/threonine-protein kinase [Halofilum sp. (in: g-proteobacteria)]|nr:serine/threonine-protein kinase [Halofilum sp. (in: g-proteobacteria)]